jgi:probable F420-dependent oxidoreductase
MMRIGVMMHVTDSTVSPALLTVEAEQRGFESMFLTEHTHIPVRPFIAWRGGEAMPEFYTRLHDPIISLATAAAVTTRIKLGTGVLVLGQREPLATAKQLASLDVLSHGRLICGVGYGWQRDELAQHGIEWTSRRYVFREHLTAVKELWTAEVAAFHGEHVSFGPSWSFPKPAQQPHPPVLLGAAGSTATLRDVVAYADGWMPVEGTEPIADRWSELQRLAEVHGRDPSSVELVIYGSSGDPATVEQHRSIGAARVVVGIEGGDIDHVRRQLDAHMGLLPVLA